MNFESMIGHADYQLAGSGHNKINEEVDTEDKHAAGDRRRGKDQIGEKKEESGRYSTTRPLSKEKEKQLREQEN